MPFCRSCGHAANAHVEGGGPCTWRGAAPFPPCHCDVYEGDAEPESGPVVDRERFLADAARAFRICYPERWDALVRAVERNWPSEAAPREADAGFQQISIEAADEEPGIQQVEIDANVEGESEGSNSVSRAANFLERVEEAAAAGNWQAAFDNLREALNVEAGREAARAWLSRVHCPACGKAVPEPSPARSTADYTRFWRGRCPTCQGALVLQE